jgi:hypothetical protein
VSIAGAASTIVVDEDVSVVGADWADVNMDSNTYRGGLFTGCDGFVSDDPSRFYLKFVLPGFVSGSSISSATLKGWYNDDFDATIDKTHSFYEAADDSWTQTGITWNNQPGALGSSVAVFDATAQAPGQWLSWDLTPLADAQYQGDGILSLVCLADDESLDASNTNWEYFARYAYDPDLAFRLEIETKSGNNPSTPELSTWALLACSGLAGFVLRRRRQA